MAGDRRDLRRGRAGLGHAHDRGPPQVAALAMAVRELGAHLLFGAAFPEELFGDAERHPAVDDIPGPREIAPDPEMTFRWL